MRTRARLRLSAIAAFAALLIVAPVLVLAVLTSRTVDVELAEREAEERVETANVAARLIDDTLVAAGASLRLLDRRVLVRDALTAGDGPALARHLADLRSASSLYDSAAAFGTDGTLLGRDPDAGINGQNFADRDYFRGAVSSTGPFVSDVFRSAAPPFNPLVAVTFAVRDGSRTLGVIQLTFTPGDVLRPVEPMARQAGRTLVVVDEADRIIASSDPASEPLGDSGLAAHWGRAAGAPSFRATIDGEDRFAIVVGLRSADWALYVIDDAEEVLAVQNELARQRLAATGATAAIALALGVLLALLYEKVAGQRDALRVAGSALTAANAELARGGKHKSEFLASMSHELRTPLNAILGFSELLQEQLAATLSERQRRYLGNITGAGTHLLALINDVLDLSKVEAGRVELRPERTSAQAVLEPVVSAATAAADERGVQLDTAIESLSLDVDIGRLRQILYNLLSNAVKFTPRDGRVSVRVSAVGSDLHLEIADTGIGIPLDRQSRVFGAFERVNEDRSESAGTGLGLALTKQLVELQGGTITFRSTPGEGTTFAVRIPGLVPDPVAGRRVLIVEDDPRAAELAVAICSELGLRTEVVTTVTVAIESARRSAPVAVLLDLQLADARGETVLREIRASSSTREVPIAIVSIEDDVGQGRSLGADEYFRKPIEPHVVSAWLRRVAVGVPADAAA